MPQYYQQYFIAYFPEAHNYKSENNGLHLIQVARFTLISN